MKLHPQSINVRGINNEQKVGVIRDHPSSLSPRVDALCLQKHKSRGDNLDMSIWMLQKRDNFWALEASLGNEVEERRLGVRRGGVAMCFPPRLQTAYL
jgi:hypothetical protein